MAITEGLDYLRASPHQKHVACGGEGLEGNRLYFYCIHHTVLMGKFVLELYLVKEYNLIKMGEIEL